jgi:sulfur-oxidizing protein SoxZ
MKNFWFIIIGIVIGFFTFYNWYLNTSTEDKSLSKKVTTPTYKNHIQKDTIIQTKRRKKDLNISSSLVTEESNNITGEEETYEEELQESSIVKPKTSNIYTINMSQAQEVKMKIKAREKGGIVNAKVAITHDMLTYAQAKKKGRQTHFITHIHAKVGNRIVYDASTSQFLSKNPLLKFQFKGKKGEKLTVIYTQITGEVFYANKRLNSLF